jgi:hypothetical protein
MSVAQIQAILGPPTEVIDDTQFWKGQQVPGDSQIVTVQTAGRMKWVDGNCSCHISYWNGIALRADNMVGVFILEEGLYQCHGTNAAYDESQGQLSTLTDRDTDSMGLRTPVQTLLNHPKGPPTGQRWGWLKTPQGKSAFCVLTWKSRSGPGYFKAYIGPNDKLEGIVVETEKKDLPAGP